MPAESLRAIRIKFAGVSDYAPFVLRYERAALSVLKSQQRDMDYVLVNALEYFIGKYCVNGKSWY
jgi:hypothetical protein